MLALEKKISSSSFYIWSTQWFYIHHLGSFIGTRLQIFFFSLQANAASFSKDCFCFSPKKLLLSRSTSDALLNHRISLPRIGNYQCDHCGHRNYGGSSSYSTGSYILDSGHVESADTWDDTWSVVPVQIQPVMRPHSVYADQNNYVRFSFRVSHSSYDTVKQ